MASKSLQAILEETDVDCRALSEYFTRKKKCRNGMPTPVCSKGILQLLRKKITSCVEQDKCIVAAVILTLDEFSSVDLNSKLWTECSEDVSFLLMKCLDYFRTSADNGRLCSRILKKFSFVIVKMSQASSVLGSFVFSNCADVLLKMVFVKDFRPDLISDILDAVDVSHQMADGSSVTQTFKSLETHLRYLAKMVFDLPHNDQATVYSLLRSSVSNPEEAHLKALIWFRKHPSLQQAFVEGYSMSFSKGSGLFLNVLFEVCEPKLIPTKSWMMDSKKGLTLSKTTLQHGPKSHADVTQKVLSAHHNKAERNTYGNNVPPKLCSEAIGALEQDRLKTNVKGKHLTKELCNNEALDHSLFLGNPLKQSCNLPQDQLHNIEDLKQKNSSAATNLGITHFKSIDELLDMKRNQWICKIPTNTVDSLCYKSSLKAIGTPPNNTPQSTSELLKESYRRNKVLFNERKKLLSLKKTPKVDLHTTQGVKGVVNICKDDRECLRPSKSPFLDASKSVKNIPEHWKGEDENEFSNLQTVRPGFEKLSSNFKREITNSVGREKIKRPPTTDPKHSFPGSKVKCLEKVEQWLALTKDCYSVSPTRSLDISPDVKSSHPKSGQHCNSNALKESLRNSQNLPILSGRYSFSKRESFPDDLTPFKKKQKVHDRMERPQVSPEVIILDSIPVVENVNNLPDSLQALHEPHRDRHTAVGDLSEEILPGLNTVKSKPTPVDSFNVPSNMFPQSSTSTLSERHWRQKVQELEKIKIVENVSDDVYDFVHTTPTTSSTFLHAEKLSGKWRNMSQAEMRINKENFVLKKAKAVEPCANYSKIDKEKNLKQKKSFFERKDYSGQQNSRQKEGGPKPKSSNPIINQGFSDFDKLLSQVSYKHPFTEDCHQQDLSVKKILSGQDELIKSPQSALTDVYPSNGKQLPSPDVYSPLLDSSKEEIGKSTGDIESGLDAKMASNNLKRPPLNASSDHEALQIQMIHSTSVNKKSLISRPLNSALSLNLELMENSSFVREKVNSIKQMADEISAAAQFCEENLDADVSKLLVMNQELQEIALGPEEDQSFKPLLPVPPDTEGRELVKRVVLSHRNPESRGSSGLQRPHSTSCDM